MIFIFLVYLLLASTFTLGKAVLSYLDPIFFIALRMTVAGSLLLGYLAFCKRDKLVFCKKDWPLFAQIILFHVYFSYVCEFWALQYVTSSKTCLLFNLSPFFTALYSYFLFGERLSAQKWTGLFIGFSGMLFVLTACAPLEELVGHLSFFSIPELVLLGAVASGAYGWIVMSKLLARDYSHILVNGIGMLVGGIMAFITSFIYEGLPQLHIPEQSQFLESFFSQYLSNYTSSILSCVTYSALLILIGNIIVYNLYGYLLRRHSPTLLSFAGFTTPLFAALLGWLFLGETISWQFLGSTVLTFIGLYLFCRKTYK
jgi:drug/metabolite transporter (DMT)-like permease